jgi:hypothetical protein
MVEQTKRRGRPPKFNEKRRPITTTLPESTLQQLEAISPDRAVAIVKAAASVTKSGTGQPASGVVEAMEVFPGHAVIVVPPSRSLREIEWLRLVEITPSRFLMALPTGTPVEALELAVTDLIEHLAPKDTYERNLLTELHRILSHRRRRQDVRKVEILLLQLK